MGNKVAIYVRESRDDNEENYETIKVQKELLIDYINKNNLGEIFRIYEDDNVSGSIFERNGMNMLKKDIEEGNINLLVLKDLSRLGRNNAKTLLFLDYLEEFEVRVVTFDGRYDSLKDNDTVGIDTWFNERYVRDISKKIRANLRHKIEKGEYIGNAPYGYIKSISEKNKLMIDENTKNIVVEIFELYKEGNGYDYIAKHLNNKKYPPPSMRNCCDNHNRLWTSVAVSRIITNRVYIGDTVQGISEKVSFKSKKTRRLPKNRWVITTSTHESIIDSNDFFEVQKIRESKRNRSGIYNVNTHLFKGLMFCGKCGEIMYARQRNLRPMGYICSTYAKKGKVLCSSHHIKEDTICKIVLEDLANLLEYRDIKDKVINKIEREFEDNDERRIIEKKLGRQLLSKQQQQDILYMDKLEGRISEELFNRMNSSIENKIVTLKEEIDCIGNNSLEMIKGEDIINKVIQNIKSNGIARNIIKFMIEKIVIYDVGDRIIENASSEEVMSVYDNGGIFIEYKFNGM